MKRTQRSAVPGGLARDPLDDLPPDARLSALKARRWLRGVVVATVAGYGSAWLIGKFSSFGWAVFAAAIAAQVVCFAFWWHYMTDMDRNVEKFVAAQGVSLEVPRGKGWSGFLTRHPVLFGVSVAVVLVAAFFLVIAAVDR